MSPNNQNCKNRGVALNRINRLGQYQKGLLLFMIVMILVFTGIYSVVISREGFEYKDTILVPNEENGDIVYSGKIQGEQASFTISGGQQVKFRYGDKTYGPYTFKEDPTAVPQDSEWGDSLTGVELRLGDEILFRGGVLNGNYRWLFNEDGNIEDIAVSVTPGHGTVLYENGTALDPMEPSVSSIVELMIGPELTHKGEWFAWLCGVLVCIITAIYILFADEIFRWNLSLQIRNADQAEPSDLEIAGRYIGWTVLAILALILFITGLQ